MASTFVISDTHFGLDSATLANSKKVDSLLSDMWRYGKGCDQIILLGDIFDFWKSTPEKAIRDSAYFFKRLSELDVQISYIVGNHDHHMAVMSQESEFLERIARGDAYPVYIPSMRWRQVINGLRITTFYPVYTISLFGRRILFTHGHHLNFMGDLYLRLEKLRLLSGKEISPADMETMITCAYEGIYRSSYIGEIASLEERIWSASSALHRFKTDIFKRSMPTDAQYDAIARFIKERQFGNVDLFIYGDTHRPGVSQRNGLVVVNTGSFMHDGNGSSGKCITDTYLVMDEDGFALRQLGKQKPVFESSGFLSDKLLF
ncbi:MAG: UDP-2,3-diacylglucosamine diphosphatase [Methanotrichaceae archaeon]